MLKQKYKSEVVSALVKEFQYSSVMEVPRIEKNRSKYDCRKRSK